MQEDWRYTSRTQAPPFPLFIRADTSWFALPFKPVTSPHQGLHNVHLFFGEVRLERVLRTHISLVTFACSLHLCLKSYVEFCTPRWMIMDFKKKKKKKKKKNATGFLLAMLSPRTKTKMSVRLRNRDIIGYSSDLKLIHHTPRASYSRSKSAIFRCPFRSDSWYAVWPSSFNACTSTPCSINSSTMPRYPWYAE